MQSVSTQNLQRDLSIDGAVHAFMHLWPVINGDATRREASWELELMACHTTNPRHLDPSCPACSRLHLQLHSIAVGVVQRVGRTMTDSFDFEVYSGFGSIISLPAAGPCVSVVIQIRDRRSHDFTQNGSPNPIARIKEALKEFGVRER